MLHIALHIGLPLLIAGVFFRARWQFAVFVMIATMLVDLDHLLATPIYDPGRCSIHMFLDALDCQITNAVWMT